MCIYIYTQLHVMYKNRYQNPVGGETIRGAEDASCIALAIHVFLKFSWIFPMAFGKKIEKVPNKYITMCIMQYNIYTYMTDAMKR